MHTIDSIIFDVDGTLWDSTETVAIAWNEIIKKYSPANKLITPQILTTLFGKMMDEIAASIFAVDSKERQLELMDLCGKLEEELLMEKGGILYPQIETVIPKLALRYPLFIVSNCQAGYIETFLSCSKLGAYFKDHLCPGDSGLDKAGNIKTIIQRNGLKAPVYIGDTDGDYRATKGADASIPFVFASYGFGHVEHPDYSISCPSDLLTLF